MSIKIKESKPMLWFIIKLFYPKAEWEKVAFTFGNTIYGVNLSSDIIAHEMVHVKQQHYSKIFACYSFLRYWISSKYRLSMEIPAYQEQWKHGGITKEKLARNISSPLYGNMISYEEALKLFI